MFSGRIVEAWHRDFFSDSLASHEQLSRVIRMSAEGIAHLKNRPEMLRSLRSLILYQEGEDPEEGINRYEEDATHAGAESDAGFPTLNKFAVLALWSWWESLIVDFTELWLTHNPDEPLRGSLPKVRIDLNDMIALRGRDRSQFIVDRIDRETSGEIKQGSGRFDTLLNAIGFNISVSDDVRKDLLEFQQVRNCLSHRFGRVDRKLLDRCPWLDLVENEVLKVDHKMVTAYSTAAYQYVVELIFTVGDRDGVRYRERALSPGPRPAAGEPSDS